MTKSGLIISPLIENTDEFGLLYSKPQYLRHKKVKSFSIKPINGWILWKNNYQITFKKVDIAK